MPTARNRTDDHAPPGHPGLHLLFPGNERAVRQALATAMAVMQTMDLGDDARGTIEIVLAEVLNNVVEHAYATATGGLIELEVDRVTDGLIFRIGDEGRPMPRGGLPEGRAQDLALEPEDLPEGGFGWLLIRELTDGVCYRRLGNRNELSFRVRLTPGAPTR